MSTPPSHDITDFTWVDRTQDPGFFREFLKRGNAVPDIQASKPIILDGLRLAPGQTILDVGCGLGDDVVNIAKIVGAGGKAVGVDVSAAMIEGARSAAPGHLNCEFHVANAGNLPFPDAAFDGARSERLLMHVPDAGAVLGEMIRVIRPGGRIAVFDFDWDTFMIPSPLRDVTRIVVRSFCDAMKNGWIGRQLPSLFATKGLTELKIVPHVVCIDFSFLELLLGGHLERMCENNEVHPSQLGAWWQSLRKIHERGPFISGFTALIVSGKKPN